MGAVTGCPVLPFTYCNPGRISSTTRTGGELGELKQPLLPARKLLHRTMEHRVALHPQGLASGLAVSERRNQEHPVSPRGFGGHAYYHSS